MIEVYTSVSGLPTAKAEGIQIHSAYDPEKEALRFLDSQEFQCEPSVCIILGSGLGYLEKNLAKRFPGTKILSVCYSFQLFQKKHYRSEPSWHPELGLSLETFFDRYIGELDIQGIKILLWQPSCLAFPEIARRAQAALNQKVRELNGNIMTTAQFGKKWIKNSVFNFLTIQRYAIPQPLDAPLIIAASGPSLVDALPLLEHARNRIILWALPSSIRALLDRGIVPDMVVQTDPGYYAFTHVEKLKGTAASVPVAMPLSAAQGVWKVTDLVMLMSTGTFFEKDFAEHTGTPAVLVPENGTVAGSAVELALRLGYERIIVAGLDFCYRDIVSHAKPHTFDSFLEKKESRFAPVYSNTFKAACETAIKQDRTTGTRTSPPLETYAGWFSRTYGRHVQKLFRLNPSPIPVPGFTDIGNTACKDLLGMKVNLSWRVFYAPNAGTKKDAANSVLRRWLETAKKARSELGNAEEKMLFDEKNPAWTLLYYIDTRGFIDAKKGSCRNNTSSLASVFEHAELFLENLIYSVQHGRTDLRP